MYALVVQPPHLCSETYMASARAYKISSMPLPWCTSCSRAGQAPFCCVSPPSLEGLPFLGTVPVAQCKLPYPKTLSGRQELLGKQHTSPAMPMHLPGAWQTGEPLFGSPFLGRDPQHGAPAYTPWKPNNPTPRTNGEGAGTSCSTRNDLTRVAEQ